MPASIRASLVIDFSPASAGLTVSVPLTTIRGFDIYDFTVLATGTQANSSAQLFTNGLAASDAVAMVTDGSPTRVATGLTNARRVVTSGQIIRVDFVAGGGATNGHAYAYVLPNAIS